MKYARIESGTVIETLNVDESVYPASKQFAPEIYATMVEADASVDQDWIYDGTTFSPPVEVAESLEEAQERLCNQVEKHFPTVLDNGFVYEAATIQTDMVAQQNVTAYQTAIIAGSVTYPIVWRTKENTFIQFQSEGEFKTFAMTMLGFVQSEYQKVWTAKDSIRAAGTVEEAETIYNNYIEA
jgi:hypothetical protein